MFLLCSVAVLIVVPFFADTTPPRLSCEARTARAGTQYTEAWCPKKEIEQMRHRHVQKFTSAPRRSDEVERWIRPTQKYTSTESGERHRSHVSPATRYLPGKIPGGKATGWPSHVHQSGRPPSGSGNHRDAQTFAPHERASRYLQASQPFTTTEVVQQQNERAAPSWPRVGPRVPKSSM